MTGTWGEKVGKRAGGGDAGLPDGGDGSFGRND